MRSRRIKIAIRGNAVIISGPVSKIVVNGLVIELNPTGPGPGGVVASATNRTGTGVSTSNPLKSISIPKKIRHRTTSKGDVVIQELE